jgi:hypothetical protein
MTPNEPWPIKEVNLLNWEVDENWYIPIFPRTSYFSESAMTAFNSCGRIVKKCYNVEKWNAEAKQIPS